MFHGAHQGPCSPIGQTIFVREEVPVEVEVPVERLVDKIIPEYRELRVEVPVEKIVEVEKEVYYPVEVEKEVYYPVEVETFPSFWRYMKYLIMRR